MSRGTAKEAIPTDSIENKCGFTVTEGEKWLFFIFKVKLPNNICEI